MLLVPAIALTLTAQVVSLYAGWNVMPAKVLELLLLLGGATIITARGGGTAAVRDLYAGLGRWRIGVPHVVLVLAALPLLTLGVATATGSLDHSKGGALNVLFLYLLFLMFGAVTANLSEETVWGGFVQQRLMSSNAS